MFTEKDEEENDVQVKKYIGVDYNGNLALTTTPYAWGFFYAAGWEEQVKTEGLEALKGASLAKPVDATFLLKDAQFNRNDHRWAAWTVSEDCTNKNLGGGGDNGNGCAESFHSVFTISQIAADAPAGTYALTAQGFYRQDDDLTEDGPVFFINEKTEKIGERTGTENNMTEAGASFLAGLYKTNNITVFVADGETLTVGIKGTATNQWVIWDNFKLTYFGAEDVTENVPTGINELTAGQNVDAIYNLSGQKVVKAGKGLYIINGKKVVK